MCHQKYNLMGTKQATSNKHYVSLTSKFQPCEGHHSVVLVCVALLGLVTEEYPKPVQIRVIEHVLLCCMITHILLKYLMFSVFVCSIESYKD